MADAPQQILVPRRWNLTAWLNDVQAALPSEQWDEIVAAAQAAGLTGDIKNDADLIKIHKYMYVMDKLRDYVDF